MEREEVRAYDNACRLCCFKQVITPKCLARFRLVFGLSRHLSAISANPWTAEKRLVP